MENTRVRLPEKLQTATEALSENLLASEQFLRYAQAQSRLNADQRANQLLGQLSTLQNTLRAKQSNGGSTPTDIDQLRAVQNEVRQNQTIVDYIRAQQAAVNYLREINQEISQLLGMDFAALTRQSSC